MVGGLLVTAFISAFQADQPRQGRSVGYFQPQRRIGRGVAFCFASVIVVVAPQGEDAKNTLNLQALASLADLTRLGLVSGVDPVGRLLQQESDEFAGRLEEGGAQEYFQLLHRLPARRAGRKLRHQLLDFGFLRESELRGWRFFLTPANRCARVRSLSIWTYCSVKASNCPWAWRFSCTAAT